MSAFIFVRIFSDFTSSAALLSMFAIVGLAAVTRFVVGLVVVRLNVFVVVILGLIAEAAIVLVELVFGVLVVVGQAGHTVPVSRL